MDIYVTTERQFEVTLSVLVEDHSGNSKWMSGIILSQLGPMNCEVLVNIKVLKRHVYQILKSIKSTSREATDLEQAEMDNSFDFPSSSDEHYSSNAQYPSRDH